jgi:3-dehydroquinate synthase
MISAACGYTLGGPLGILVSWVGMTSGCLAGYFIGSTSRKVSYFSHNGRAAKAELFFSRYGNWGLVICRAIPVLAESSVVYAGFCGMPFSRFLWMTALSNLGISGVYAFTGAFYSEKHSFYLAFFASVFVPVLLAGLVRLAGTGPAPGKSWSL